MTCESVAFARKVFDCPAERRRQRQRTPKKGHARELGDRAVAALAGEGVMLGVVRR